MADKAFKKQSFLQGAAVLAAATAIVKIIGAIYKIPLGIIIGDEGFSYFGKAYQIYEVLLMISTTGLPVAMSRMVSEAQTLENHDQIRKIFSTALRVFLTLGILGSALMVFFAKPLSNMVATDESAWFAIAMLGPAVLFICLISAFRGFFQGQSNMTPTSVSQVMEAVCKLVIGLGAAWLIMKLSGDVTYGSGGAILGVTVGCVVSAAYLFRCYRKASRDLPTGGSVKSTGETMRQLLAIAVPITLGSAGLQIINLVDTVVYMNRLVGALGLTAARANELSGIYEFCRTIFNLPCAFITPITISIIPAITSHLTMKNGRGVRVVEGSAMRITGLIAAPCAFGLLSLSGPIMALLRGYTGEKLEIAGVLMAVLGITVVFNSLILVTNAIMQAHGDVTTPVIHMIVGGCIKVVINFLLVAVPSLHIMGVAIGTLLCYLIIIVLNVIAMIRKKTIDPRSFAGIGKPLLAGLLMGAVAFMANGVLTSLVGGKLACLAAICVAAAVYFVLVYALRIITYDDCMLLPGGEKIAKILRVNR